MCGKRYAARVTPWAVSQTTPKNHSRHQGKLSVLKEQYQARKMQDARLSNVVRLWRKVFQRWEKEAAARLQTHDENVTNVTKFPFMGGSLSRNRDLLERHADLSPRLHFIRYHKALIIDEIPGYLVATSQMSKSVDKYVVRKFGVVR